MVCALSSEPQLENKLEGELTLVKISCRIGSEILHCPAGSCRIGYKILQDFCSLQKSVWHPAQNPAGCLLKILQDFSCEILQDKSCRILQDKSYRILQDIFFKILQDESCRTLQDESRRTLQDKSCRILFEVLQDVHAKFYAATDWDPAISQQSQIL